MLERMCNIRRDLNGVNTVSSGKVYSIDLSFWLHAHDTFLNDKVLLFQWKTSHHKKRYPSKHTVSSHFPPTSKTPLWPVFYMLTGICPHVY